MNLRTLALILVASQIAASSAYALERKPYHHPRDEDRLMSATSDRYFGPVGRAPAWTPAPAVDPLNRDPLSSANGS
jgi:hypothetical protein